MQVPTIEREDMSSPARALLESMQKDVHQYAQDLRCNVAAAEQETTPTWIEEWTSSLPGSVRHTGAAALRECGVTDFDDVFLISEAPLDLGIIQRKMKNCGGVY